MGGFRQLRLGFAGIVIGSSVLLSACDPIAFVSNQALRFVERNLVPPMLQDNDVRMACQSGVATAPLIMATENLGADANQLGTLLYTTAGLCAEIDATEAELRYLRAARAGNVEEAQDARISQKRFAELAARRQLLAYQRFVTYYEKRYDIEIGEQCTDFYKDFDEFVYMLGLVTGLQAVLNDIVAQQVVGVPLDIAAKAERAFTCLDNKKWWGVPLAARAVVWNVLPGADEGKDPWGALNASMALGEEAGVRLPHAMYALSAAGKDDQARLRDAIRRFANVKEGFKPNVDYRLADSIAGLLITTLSDRMWTEGAGTRTPSGMLGKFWDEKAERAEGIDISDLL
ncbi:hypothetical protein DFR26_0026 [Paraperlucidibaca baekdonensis]|uniref:Uncharacterized protein n=1 Tax=Paraperlucidibaca baekdonensis TaxID=748120 RepID=A0A3E0H7W7_9GAMM|nr:hypothetical protein [Paraperlucidibaca baekdonensis]REH39835.1 hypothetical protein DFR26_0026 [Paraperlucidibaca baekdonensis]